MSLTLFAFDADTEISTHASEGDAMVTVLTGSCRYTVDGTPHLLHAGETMVMPAGKPHAVYAPGGVQVAADGGVPLRGAGYRTLKRRPSRIR